METPNSKVSFVDRSVLEHMRRFQEPGAEHPAIEMIDLFLAVAPSLVFELRDLWKKRSFGELQEQAERFQLSCESVGANAMAELCVMIQSAAGQSPEELKPLIEELFMVYTYVEIELMEWNNSQSHDFRKEPSVAIFR